MRILYAAPDQPIPGTQGGSVHVTSVAEGLAARGHDVHVLASPGEGAFPSGAVHWYDARPPMGMQKLRLLRSARVLTRARTVQPDVIIERYYNFGGEGLLAASAVGALAVLEVNAPIIDYAGSPKQWVDRALVVQPMRRWRNWQCTHSDLIVTPLSDIVPESVPHERILEIEWGADTARFHPSAAGVIPFHREAGEIIVVFSGAFRAWHGAIHLVRAVAQLQASGRRDIKAVFIGDGPELERVRREASGLTGVIFTGSLPHNQMPACLAAADIGVAPFDVTAFGPLSLGFFWSPLKVFEYMAAGLPVVAPNIDRLSQLIEDGREGVLYDASDPTALATALTELADSVNRQKLAVAARHRAVNHYGWDSHCRKLEQGIRSALNRRTSVG